MEREKILRVTNAFGLGEAIEVSPLPGTRNRNFAVRTTGGRWVIRLRYAGYCSPAQIEFDHGALAFLTGCGVSVPAPLKHTGGGSVYRDGPDSWEVFPFIGGLPMREGDSMQAASLGREMARFHQVGKYLMLRFRKMALRGETDPAVLLQQALELANQDRETADAVKGYRRWVEEAAAVLPDDRFQALPHTLVHGDIQPANLLFEGTELSAFLDLDWCGWQARIYDLAYAILFCCSLHEGPIDGGNIWSLTQAMDLRRDLLNSFLGAYEAGGFHLNPEERTALPAQVTLTWCHCRLAGAFKVEASRRAEFLTRPPEHMDDWREILAAI
jgi:Ser/Thr protein kinase RdoA (MazF antagonist)